MGLEIRLNVLSMRLGVDGMDGNDVAFMVMLGKGVVWNKKTTMDFLDMVEQCGVEWDGVLEFPRGVVECIQDASFYNIQGLKSVVIPSSVKHVGKWAFYYCRNLEKVVIEDGVRTVGDGAFAGCTSLKEVRFPNILANINIFMGMDDCRILRRETSVQVD